MADTPSISIVTAFYNEAENLPLFRERITTLAASRTEQFEFVLLDDHSSDTSPDYARQWAAEDSRRQIRTLVSKLGLPRRICGRAQFLHRRLRSAAGRRPAGSAETVPQLLEQWQAGSDVVWAVRMAREGETRATKGFAAAYYWLMRRIALPNMPAKGADFLLVDRKVIDGYNAIGEKNTSILAMILWMGFRQSFVPYVKQARHSGRSKWTIAKKLKLFIDSIASFSYAPIRVMSLIGLCTAAAGFFYAALVVIGRLFNVIQTGTGFAALMTVLLMGQGITMIMLGVLGEYVWRTYDEARGRPRYLVEEFIDASESAGEEHGYKFARRAA